MRGFQVDGVRRRIVLRSVDNGTGEEFLAGMLHISCLFGAFLTKMSGVSYIFTPKYPQKFPYSFIGTFTVILYLCIQHILFVYPYEARTVTTEVLSIRVKKNLKHEAEKLGVDIKAEVENLLGQLVAEKKAKAQQIAKDLREAMDVTPEEWAVDVRATRDEM